MSYYSGYEYLPPTETVINGATGLYEQTMPLPETGPQIAANLDAAWHRGNVNIKVLGGGYEDERTSFKLDSFSPLDHYANEQSGILEELHAVVFVPGEVAPYTKVHDEYYGVVAVSTPSGRGLMLVRFPRKRNDNLIFTSALTFDPNIETRPSHRIRDVQIIFETQENRVVVESANSQRPCVVATLADIGQPVGESVVGNAWRPFGLEYANEAFVTPPTYEYAQQEPQEDNTGMPPAAPTMPGQSVDEFYWRPPFEESGHNTPDLQFADDASRRTIPIQDNRSYFDSPRMP